MKYKHPNTKYFLSYSYPKKSFSFSYWEDEIDINIAVNTLSSTPEANVSLPHIQTGGLNMSTPYIQIEGNSISMLYGQDIGTLTLRPNIESIVILYGDNQLADPDL